MEKEPTTAQIAADYIKQYDKALADLFIDRPFHRVAIAKAFAKGLRNDTLEMGLTIIALAELDREDRMDQTEC